MRIYRIALDVITGKRNVPGSKCRGGDAKDLPPPRHPKQAARPTASWACRRLRDFLVYDAVDPLNKRVVAYRPIRNA